MAKKELPSATTDEAEARQQQESPPAAPAKPAGKVFVVVTCKALTPLLRNPMVLELNADESGQPTENAWEKFKEFNGISGCADGFDERVVTAEQAAEIDKATDEAEAAAKEKAKALSKRPL